MQLIDKDKCLEQIIDITEDIEHSNSNVKFRFKKNETISRTHTDLIFDKAHNKYH